MVLLETFAAAYRLKLKKDNCGEWVVVGKHGQIYQDGRRLGVMIIVPEPSHAPSSCPEPSRQWANCKRAGRRTGFKITQDGDYEGAMLFSPDDKKQAKLALRFVGAKVRRQISPIQAAVLEKGRSALPARRS